jgi:hypothetical protein
MTLNDSEKLNDINSAKLKPKMSRNQSYQFAVEEQVELNLNSQVDAEKAEN